MSRLAKIGIGVFALILFIVPFVINPFQVQVVILTITYAMLGLAFALSMRVGLPRLDVGAWYGVGAYTTALLLKAGWNFFLAALIGGFIAVAIGYIIFSLAIPRGMLAFFALCLVVPMAFYQMFGSVKIFGGWGGTINVPPPMIGSFAIVTKPQLYFLALFFLALTITVYYLLYNSRIGRAWDAIGSSLKLAGSTGINVVRYRLANVLIGNFFIALAGSLLVAFYRAAVPMQFSFAVGLPVMGYLIIGGMMHSLTGPILGAIIVTFIPEYFRFAQQYQSIIVSVIVILILMFLPMGITGWIDQKVKPWLLKKQWYKRIDDWSMGRTASA